MEGTETAGGVLTITAPSPVGAVATKAYDNTYITSGTYCAEKIYLPEADLQWLRNMFIVSEVWSLVKSTR